MSRSPAHYAAYCPRDEPTPAQRFGSAVHALVLGGDVIVYEGERTGARWAAFKGVVDGKAYSVFDGAHRGSAWEAAKADAQAAGELIVTSEDVALAGRAAQVQRRRRAAQLYDAPIVTSAEHDRARRCADAVLASPVAAELLNGLREEPLAWHALGRPCAGTVDVLRREGITELKTTTNAEPEWFRRHALRMGYHAQIAWYAEGAANHGFAGSAHHIVAVETTPPFAVTALRLTERALVEGAKLARTWLERLLVCEDADAWPAYAQSVLELDVDPGFELDFGRDGSEGTESEAQQ